MTAKRHGWAAALLSLLTPGLGHLYAGRVRSAFVLGILVTPFAALLFLLDVLAAPPAALFFLFGVAILLTVVVGIPIHAALLARRTGLHINFSRLIVLMSTLRSSSLWGSCGNVVLTCSGRHT